MDVGLVPERETHDDDCDDEELVDVGLVPIRDTHDDDCEDEELVDVGLSPDGRHTMTTVTTKSWWMLDCPQTGDTR